MSSPPVSSPPVVAPVAPNTVLDRVDDIPPPIMPARPKVVDPREEQRATLKEAFPDVEDKVIRAILIAADYNPEKAFNALLSLTDDSFQPETPARPNTRSPAVDDESYARQIATATDQSQLEADERLARELSERYERRAMRRAQEESQRHYRQNEDLYGRETPENQRSFLDDDLPVIKENLTKGFNETRKNITGWFTKVKGRLENEFAGQEQQGQGQGQYGQYQGRVSGQYDADPRVLGDDFSALEIRDNSGDAHRAPTNPNLFKPSLPSRGNSAIATEDLTSRTASSNLAPSNAGAAAQASSPSRKWEPLRARPPPTNADPFDLGDSDDEAVGGPALIDNDPSVASRNSGRDQDLFPEASQRLRRASMAEPSEETKSRRASTAHAEKLEEAGKAGTRDSTAVGLLTKQGE
ncbi:hypothetical protein G7K_2762-t1 [Saitoella complicata NRRL Y-17804]|uniref:CUE domain-containing protein n=1 Tax=Saitoella complicata (strain BCRC 22490 / CBS 7301 / JCM 7358 / NBRC 10748 / NRRL Y-17804) TaxID=698492 RepID=A0A0E9NGQ4_SAICN|nr:hypothetical protein G7K_2762-t1 [Saitoella complicata NRRL Y-17804]